MHPLEASRALKRVSAHIQMADGAGVPGVRMVADGARVRMDITTNKEQCQDKETPKGGPVNKKKRSRPVVIGQRVAQQKNSPRQWGRPFSRAPREICPAISTHPHWGGDCTTTMRWQAHVAERIRRSLISHERAEFVRFAGKLHIINNYQCNISQRNLSEHFNA